MGTDSDEKNRFTVFVNFERWDLPLVEPDWTLSYFVRETVKLKGTKIGCSEGGCGSCTVLLSKWDSGSNSFKHKAVNSCISPLINLHGAHILTVEGISDDSKSCHEIQDSIATNHGTQCGFCTPGMVMSMYGQVVNQGQKEINIDGIHAALQGNLCRCTGYRPILEAFVGCGKKCGGGEPCNPDIEDSCKVKKSNVQFEAIRDINNDHEARILKIEDILSSFSNDEKDPLAHEYGWLQPTSVNQALEIMQKDTSAIVAGGMTELWQLMNSRNSSTAITVINLDKIPKMKEIKRCDEGDVEPFLRIGAAVTISDMVAHMKKEIEELPTWKTRGLKAIVDLMALYGSEQIRNTATVGGSLMSSMEASDMKLFYEVLNCWAYRYDLDSKTPVSRRVPISNKRRCLVEHLQIPYTKQNEFVQMIKVSKRKYTDAPIMSLAGKVRVFGNDCVQTLLLGFNGLAIERFSLDFNLEPNSVRIGDASFFEMVVNSATREMKNKLCKDVSRPAFSEEYLELTLKNMIRKCFDGLRTDIESQSTETSDNPNFTFVSSQLFRKEQDSSSDTGAVGSPLVHASAYKHATGEARYCDDTPALDKELFLAFVHSERAHARILDVDPAEALAVAGVVGFVSHQDAVKNTFGIAEDDEEIFASEKVTCHGQIIAGILASDRVTAARAAKMVKVRYEDLQPRILGIQDAVKHGSYHSSQNVSIKRLLNDTNTPSEDVLLDGEFRVGTQAHFYLEPQGCIAIPKGEDEEMEVISATQNPNGIQQKCAEALGIPYNRIIVKVKRIGGGFGGKETRCLLVALPTVVAAKKFNRPVRCILDREADMRISGKRHAFLANYKIVVSPNGKIKSLKVFIHADGGNTIDVSVAAVERALVSIDNAYHIPNFEFDGVVCKTNLPSNTAFRGTGGPQAVLIIEGILDRVATRLGMDPTELRQRNFYQENQVTPYGQILTNVNIARCWDQCLEMSDYQSRVNKIKEFNASSQYIKRGISVNPVHFGISYTVLFLNQGAALIHIYVDGSVLVTHGGVEIGQGLHTKILQITSRALKVDTSRIRISETATDKVPNSTPTSASVGTDLVGPAIVNACETLLQRLEPYLEKTNNVWNDAVSMAYMDRVSLSATGFHKVPKIGWNEAERKGTPFSYYSTGTSCTEVELDCLTGHYKVLRTDIVMDVGQSLNPAIDIGQVEGAFLQGTGFYTLEELQIDDQGKLLTVGPSTYKLPNCSNSPMEFNVAILSGSTNPHAVYSSKAIGEPPLLLATSVFYAIKGAIRSYRQSNGLSPDFQLDSPATVERIVLATAK